MALVAGMTMLFLSGLLNNKVTSLAWWCGALPGTLLASLMSACAALVVNRMFECVLPSRVLDVVASRADWRAGACLSAVLVGGAAIGIPAGLALGDLLFSAELWRMTSNPQEQVRFVAFLAMLALVCMVGERLQAHQRDLQRELTDAQLRLLRAQIEPSRLFDALESVHRLVDRDPQGAKLALEDLTDHLRENLGHLREATTLN
jgi:hypothetical protein